MYKYTGITLFDAKIKKAKKKKKNPKPPIL